MKCPQEPTACLFEFLSLRPCGQERHVCNVFYMGILNSITPGDQSKQHATRWALGLLAFDEESCYTNIWGGLDVLVFNPEKTRQCRRGRATFRQHPGIPRPSKRSKKWNLPIITKTAQCSNGGHFGGVPFFGSCRGYGLRVHSVLSKYVKSSLKVNVRTCLGHTYISFMSVQANIK